MPRNILLVQSDPVPGREEEYQRWYTDQHLADVLRVPGFSGAQRFALGSLQRPGNPDPAYGHIAIYEIEGPVERALASLDHARANGMYVSEAMHPGRVSHVFTSITDLRTT